MDKDLTFGSNTLQIIKYINCPVLAILSDYNKTTLRNYYRENWISYTHSVFNAELV